MQRKNDELKAKMELYEAAGIVDTADAADMVNQRFTILTYFKKIVYGNEVWRMHPFHFPPIQEAF